MKQLLNSFNGLLFILTTIIGLSGCVKETVKEPVITLNCRELNVSSGGGEYTVGFKVDNRRGGVTLEAFEYVDWITIIEVSEDQIFFSVSPNTSEDESREATVSVSYYNVKDSFKVIQPAAGKVDDDSFKISIVVNYSSDVSVNASFTPSDVEATYYVAAVKKSEFDVAESEDEFIKSLSSQFNLDAVKYGLSIYEYMSDYVLKSGEVTKDIVGLSPETDYYIIAVGFNVSAEPTSGIFKESVTTTESSGHSSVSFKITAEANNASVTMKAEPSDNEIRYTFSYISSTYLDYLGVDDISVAVQTLLDEEIKYGTDSGLSVSEIIEHLSCFGPAQYTVELQPDVNYIIYAAAISDQGVIISDVSYIEYKIEIEKSDNDFNITVDDISVDKAHLIIETKNDDPYAIALASSSSWGGLTDDQIVQAAISSGLITEWSGDYDNTLKGLKANTSYIVVVFGYSASVVTTHVVKYNFSTIPAGDPDDLEFEFHVDEITSRGATVTVSCTPENSLYFWYIKPSEMTEDQIKNEYENIIQNYINSGMISSRLDYFKITGSRGTEKYVFKSLSPDTEYRLFAIGINESDGSYSTTMRFSHPFQTLAAKDVDIVVEVNVPHYFDCNEIINAGYDAYSDGAGMAMVELTTSISGTDECFEYYYYIVLADLSDKSQYSDEFMINDVLYAYGFHNLDMVHAFAPFDKVCTLVAIGLDNNGNVGDLYRKTIKFTKDGVSDIKDFKPLGGDTNSSRRFVNQRLTKDAFKGTDMSTIF